MSSAGGTAVLAGSGTGIRTGDNTGTAVAKEVAGEAQRPASGTDADAVTSVCPEWAMPAMARSHVPLRLVTKQTAAAVTPCSGVSRSSSATAKRIRAS
jgi:hypothetical protein